MDIHPQKGICCYNDESGSKIKTKSSISSLLHAFGNSLGFLAADGNVSSGRVVFINTCVDTAVFIDVARAVEDAFGIVANVVALDYSFRFVNLYTPAMRADVGAGRVLATVGAGRVLARVGGALAGFTYVQV